VDRAEVVCTHTELRDKSGKMWHKVEKKREVPIPATVRVDTYHEYEPIPEEACATV
jgi:hypothetical protein